MLQLQNVKPYIKLISGVDLDEKELVESVEEMFGADVPLPMVDKKCFEILNSECLSSLLEKTQVRKYRYKCAKENRAGECYNYLVLNVATSFFLNKILKELCYTYECE